ncbi:IPIL1 protein, partial [Turnix velox]|nr:IPIL1 protein [Turnix velox]
DWIVEENTITYRLPVSLRPPPGHSFSMELDTTGPAPAKPTRVLVMLECICSRGKLLGGSLCFLHQPDNKLPLHQSSLFLRTLCSHSYLDLAKVTCWIQQLVPSAWLLLPHSRHCQLTVTSSDSCTFQLTGTSKMTVKIEIMIVMK